MLTHPNIDPVAISIGPLAIHWYGISYMVAFAFFYWLGVLRTKQQPYASNGWQAKDVENLLFYGVWGIILGGRLGYCLFYQPHYYFQHPLEIIYIWQGGMAFHGGLLGATAAILVFAYKQQRNWLEVADFVAPCIPIGLACGRIGNFINGELWGRFADPSLPWAMVFPHSGSMQPRHPSQLYQFLLEGLLLFALLWLFARQPRRRGEVAAAFLIGYSILRFIAEFFRQPDSHLGLLQFNMTMGQWLCVPMLLVGIAVFLWARIKPAN